MEAIDMQIVSALNRLAQIVHRNAIGKGFHPDDQTTGEFVSGFVANTHGEVSEFWEAYRKGKLELPCDKDCVLTYAEEELADIAIRVFDAAARLNINIGHAIMVKHEFNTTRPYRHGDKNA